MAMESIILLPSQFIHFEPEGLPENLINLILVVKKFLKKFLLNNVILSVQIFVLKDLPKKITRDINFTSFNLI